MADDDEHLATRRAFLGCVVGGLCVANLQRAQQVATDEEEFATSGLLIEIEEDDE